MDIPNNTDWQERALDRFEVLRADAAAASGAQSTVQEQINAAARARREAEAAVADAERPAAGTPTAVAEQAREDAARALERAKSAFRRAVARRDAAEVERHAHVGRAHACAAVLVRLGLITEAEVML